jgi:hypothetical protein
VVPEHAGGDRTPGTPSAGDAEHPLRARHRSEALHLTDGADQCQVTDRPHVPPAESHEQIDVRAPVADPIELDQLRSGGVVLHLHESTWVEPALNDCSREAADVCGLLPAHSRGPEGRVVEFAESVRTDAAGRLAEPFVRRAGRAERDLLLEDDLDERAEPRLARPERRRPETIHNHREMRITAPELGDALRERLRGQWERHVAPTMRVTGL